MRLSRHPVDRMIIISQTCELQYLRIGLCNGGPCHQHHTARDHVRFPSRSGIFAIVAATRRASSEVRCLRSERNRAHARADTSPAKLDRDMLRRAGIGTASEQNCYLRGCEQRWMIFVIEERSYELSLRGMARDKLLTVQFPTRRRCI